VLRRAWVPRGSRPVARQCPGYDWLYVYAFIRPSDGETFWLFMPTVSVEAFQLALDEFAQFASAGPDHQVVLVVDGAGWHTSRQLNVPEGLHLLKLPPYSPELQPVERLWPLLREALANRPVANLSQLEARLIHRVKALKPRKDYLSGLVQFHWWKDAERPIV
jgi:hypothetical protein